MKPVVSSFGLLSSRPIIKFRWWEDYAEVLHNDGAWWEGKVGASDAWTVALRKAVWGV